jgi:hypothetical protein
MLFLSILLAVGGSRSLDKTPGGTLLLYIVMGLLAIYYIFKKGKKSGLTKTVAK